MYVVGTACVVGTVCALHRTVFAYGDLGPHNIIFKNGRIFIIDWERARLVRGILGLHEDALCSRPSCNAREVRAARGTR